MTDNDAELDESVLDEAQQAMYDARNRLADVPAEVVVSNHVMGLYELAAIHLSAEPPALHEAALAIDAVGCLVEGLGERLGAEAETFTPRHQGRSSSVVARMRPTSRLIRG